MKSTSLFVTGAVLLAALHASPADARRVDPRCKDSPECGWWYGYNPIPDARQRKQEQPEQSKPQTEEAKTEEEMCQDADTWSLECGFVDPNVAYPDDRQKAYEFQSQQRDTLLNEMAMNPNNRKGVEAMQYYTRWVVGQAVNAAKMWQFNNTQTPELNPNTDYPVSTHGLRLLKEERRAFDQRVYDELAEGGALLMFWTRPDCSYCHGMAGTIIDLALQTGIPVAEASLGEGCVLHSEEHIERLGYVPECKIAPETDAPAKKMAISVVPDLVMWMPEDETFVRMATGIESLSVIKARIVTFMGAITAAQAHAIQNGGDGTPSVDFSENSKIKGLGQGQGALTP